MQLEQEVVLLQSAEHAGKAAGQTVHPAERRHANLTWLVAAAQDRKQFELKTDTVLKTHNTMKHFVM